MFGLIDLIALSGLLFLVLVFSAVILGTVFWIWMLIECAMKESSQTMDKLVWVLVILFTHFLGAAIYFIFRRPRRIAETGA